MSNPFRVGDKVSLDGCEKDVCTIVDRTSYYCLDRGTHSYGEKRLQLVEPSIQRQRGELEHAIDVFDRHNIRRSYDDDYRIRGESIWYNKEQLLNRLFPVGNPAIEEIEAEMRTLADRLRELKNERP